MKKILETGEEKFNTEPQPAPEIPKILEHCRNSGEKSIKPARKTRMYQGTIIQLFKHFKSIL
jgi:hypothetical protein